MTHSISSIREGFHTVTPYLITPDAAQLIDFVKEVFNATETMRGTGSAGGIHAEVRISNSMVMIGGGTWKGEPSLATLYLYMDEVDTVYLRALHAGATSISAPADQDFGDRLAGIKDPFGNIWYIATPLPEK